MGENVSRARALLFTLSKNLDALTLGTKLVYLESVLGVLTKGPFLRLFLDAIPGDQFRVLDAITMGQIFRCSCSGSFRR